jgi:hypothetical protein
MPAEPAPSPLPVPLQIEILMEEYRQLYELVRFRLSALDQRVPLAGFALIAAVAGIGTLTVSSQVILLIAVPLSLVWWYQVAAQHALSFTDALRRIAEIEQRVNGLGGTPLLQFQSSHPGRTQVGGRTGQRTVQAVLAGSAVVLAACLPLGNEALHGSPWLLAYDAFLAGTAAALVIQARSFVRYRYAPIPQASPLA